jgi:hypothetical protein
VTKPTHVHVTEPKETARLLGPDGKVIAAVVDRQPIAFGFQPTAKDEDEPLDTDSVHDVY